MKKLIYALAVVLLTALGLSFAPSASASAGSDQVVSIVQDAPGYYGMVGFEVTVTSGVVTSSLNMNNATATGGCTLVKSVHRQGRYYRLLVDNATCTALGTVLIPSQNFPPCGSTASFSLDGILVDTLTYGGSCSYTTPVQAVQTGNVLTLTNVEAFAQQGSYQWIVPSLTHTFVSSGPTVTITPDTHFSRSASGRTAIWYSYDIVGTVPANGTVTVTMTR